MHSPYFRTIRRSPLSMFVYRLTQHGGHGDDPFLRMLILSNALATRTIGTTCKHTKQPNPQPERTRPNKSTRTPFLMTNGYTPVTAAAAGKLANDNESDNHSFVIWPSSTTRGDCFGSPIVRRTSSRTIDAPKLREKPRAARSFAEV